MQLFFPLSALNKFNIDAIDELALRVASECPPYFEKDTLTDKSERFFVSETIPKRILKYYKKEISLFCRGRCTEFKEEKDIIRIRTIIYVIRDSQKGIIIGHQGKSLKKVGSMARRDLEQFSKRKSF